MNDVHCAHPLAPAAAGADRDDGVGRWGALRDPILRALPGEAVLVPANPGPPERIGVDLKYRMGIVGMGARANKVLPDALRHAGVELSALCDPDPSRAAQEHDAPCFDDVDAMLDQVQLDFIIVMTPHDTHLPIVRAAAQRGVHVLKEKPFARTLDEARELQAICQVAGIHLMTIVPRRFNPNYQLFHAWMHRVGRSFLVELRFTKFVGQPGLGWRGESRRAGGGCIIDMGYHMVDLLLWNLGLPDAVRASMSASATPDTRYDTEDTALVTFTYASGLHGSLVVSRFMPDQEGIRLVGSEGILEATPKSIRFLGNDGSLIEEARLNSPRSPMAEQLDCFLAVLRLERPNFAGPAEHLLHARMVDACYASQKAEGGSR